MELTDVWKRPRHGVPPLVQQDAPGKALRTRLKEALRSGVEGSPLGERLLWRLPATDAGECARAAVALTFDDGPDPEHTPRILEILAEHGARATFFLVGTAVLRYPELVRRICAEGHALGNHTHTHARCRRLGFAALSREIGFADIALRVACPEVALPLFRPPFGELRPDQALWLASQGRTIAFWNQDSRDYRDATVDDIARLGEMLAPRDMVLLHDRFPATQKALPELLRALKDRGLHAAALPGSGVGELRGVEEWESGRKGERTRLGAIAPTASRSSDGPRSKGDR